LLEDSLAAAGKAIGLDPANANAHEFAGMIRASMGEMDAARESFERALALNPSKPDFYVHYGIYFLRLGDWKQGVSLVKEGIALSPSPPGWMRMPLALDAFRRGDYAGSLHEAQAVIETGDMRGVLLALAASAAVGNQTLTDRYLADLRKMSPGGLKDPMGSIRKVYDDPVLVAKYEEVLSGVIDR
jgi:tetratricopeptide (TPR) repeat protein